jgi:hypothetical protein
MVTVTVLIIINLLLMLKASKEDRNEIAVLLLPSQNLL